MTSVSERCCDWSVASVTTSDVVHGHDLNLLLASPIFPWTFNKITAFGGVEEMNGDICKTFERVAEKMGWMDEGLDSTEKKLRSMIGKTRHAGTSGSGSGFAFAKAAQSESSDEEFDKFLVENFTPKAKAKPQNPHSAAKTGSSTVLVESSDDEDAFAAFLQRVKTPAAKAKKTSGSGSEDSLKNFIVDDYSSDDDFLETKSSLRVPKKINTPAERQPFRRPVAQFNSPVFVSDSGDDDEDNVVIRSTWKARHSKPRPQQKEDEGDSEEENRSPASPVFPSLSDVIRPPSKGQASTALPGRTFSAPSRLDESSSSEEEFASLLERLRKNNKCNLTGTSLTPKPVKGSEAKLVVSAPAVKTFAVPVSKPLKEKPLDAKPQGKASIVKPVSQTEPRPAAMSRIRVCKTPGCFLESLTIPGSTSGSTFKTNKEELTSKLYRLYNSTIFDNQLPTTMSVTWNKKMRKTAGHCITGREKGGGPRYARIELSEKVCDTADRLRDTLIHEMCHAATWLINGVRDGHGNLWKLYARKATTVHPELPMVTRCHSYDITYKFKYQCSRCQNTIGRHSKSLDTAKFVCALCTGQLVLLTPSKPRAPTPFATFVKENYGNVRQKLAGQSHAEVMRKLSADFASKTKLGES
uniref:Germ cell nuclear acidic peptidase n=1 Tax=Fundulus heteroclitus TaxID=8078 RepID=A0A3Q2QI64_FUNHE